MSAKIKYMLKQKEGVLHIGGGRFFYPGITYSLSQVEAGNYEQYFDKETESIPDPPTKPKGKQPEIPVISPKKNPPEDQKGTVIQEDTGAESSTLSNLDKIMEG